MMLRPEPELSYMTSSFSSIALAVGLGSERLNSSLFIHSNPCWSMFLARDEPPDASPMQACNVARRSLELYAAQ